MTRRRKGLWTAPIPTIEKIGLDLDAAPGRYGVDHFAELCPTRDDAERYHDAWHANPLRCVRETATIVGQTAADVAAYETGGMERAERERMGLAALDNVRGALDRLAAHPPSGASFTSGPGIDPLASNDALFPVLVQADALRDALAELERNYTRLVAKRPGPGAAKSLERAFFLYWRDVGWPRVTGKEKAPRSRQGDFVRLMAASWLDLGFRIDEGAEEAGSGIAELLGRYAQRPIA